MDPRHRGRGQSRPEPVAQQVGHVVAGQRTERQLQVRLGAQLRADRSGLGPLRRQYLHRQPGEPARDELQNARARLVDPLQVVNDHEYRRLRRQDPHQLQYRQPDRQLVLRRGRRDGTQQGRVQRGPQMPGQQRALLGQGRAEQVHQREVRQAGLHLRGCRAQHAGTAQRVGEHGQDGGLADPRRPDDEHAAAAGQLSPGQTDDAVPAHRGGGPPCSHDGESASFSQIRRTATLPAGHHRDDPLPRRGHR